LTFIEEFAGRGHNVHELTRDVLLGKLWAARRGEFLELSRRAADYFFGLDGDSDAEVEACYHEVLNEGEGQTGRLLDRAIDWWTYRRLDLLQSTIQRLEEHQKSQHLDNFGDGWLQHLLGLQEMLSARYKRAGQYFERGREYYDEAAIVGDRYYAALLRDFANSYYEQADHRTAEPLYQRALDICERQLGADHPDTATSLNNLAVLYCYQARWGDAERLLVRALLIRTQKLGEAHPDTQGSTQSLQLLVKQAIQQNRTAELSDHPLTQQLLAQLRTNER
jgi:tetratricopeptide (TPR) repeat protein